MLKLFVEGVVVLAGLLAVTYWLTPENKYLAMKYGVPLESGRIEPEPHGCDFEDAPLGKKHCYFERVLDTESACSGPDCPVTNVHVWWRKVIEE